MKRFELELQEVVHAPWLAVLAGLVAPVFLILLGWAVFRTLSLDHNLIGLGAISSAWRPLFFLPPLVIVLVAGMLVAAVAMWVGHHRSGAGKVYYSLLTLCGLSTVASLSALAVVGLWR